MHDHLIGVKSVGTCRGESHDQRLEEVTFLCLDHEGVPKSGKALATGCPPRPVVFILMVHLLKSLTSDLHSFI